MIKNLILLILLLLSNSIFAQKEKKDLYFYMGPQGGCMQDLLAFGMTTGVSIYNVDLSAGFMTNDHGNEKAAAIGYTIRLGKHFSIVPKAGYLWGSVYETEDTYSNKSLGVLASYHINHGSGYVEYFGKTFSIGFRFMSWYNNDSKKYY